MSYEDNDGKTQVYNPQAYGSNDRTQTFSASDETQQATVADAPALHELFPEHEDADATVVAPGAQAARIRTAHAQHSPYASQATQNYATQNPYGATQNFASQNPYGVQATQNISSQSPYGQGGDGNDSGDGKKDKGMFSDISFAQVTATALAAVTSTLLSSQIGIAGSIIGVGLGAAASAVATSIYKNILSRSADKLKSLKDSGEEQIEGVMDSSELGSYEIGPDGQRIASDSMLAAADSQRKRQKRIAIAVTSIAAVAAVAIGAAVINVSTAGNGLGTKTTFAAPAQQSESADDTKADDQKTDDKKTDTTNTLENRNLPGRSHASGSYMETDFFRDLSSSAICTENSVRKCRRSDQNRD